MDLVTQTSLEALLLKATNSKNLNFDTAAVEAFCTLVNKEKDGVHIGVKVIAARLPAGEEKEMLQTLNVLDHCMSKCGTPFQNEVGKFRFLNELIKLVSPKYLGSQTPLTVKQKILQLLYVWTLDYPKETKIIEAFDMLRKQGVVREIPNPNVPYDVINSSKQKAASSIFQDEEKSKILQKLLQSKDPEDIQAANWLIKSMVKEDDKRAEMKSKRVYELESIQNNVRLLNEMLDSYKSNTSSDGELDLIKELYQNCERLRPSVNKLILETHQDEGILDDILKTNDEISATFEKYNTLIVQGKSITSQLESNDSLLQFEIDTRLVKDTTQKDYEGTSVDVLCDIFTNNSIPDSGDVLKPISIAKCDTLNSGECSKEKPKLTGFEELDLLGHHLLNENIESNNKSNRSTNEKVPMNQLSKFTKPNQPTPAVTKPDTYHFDLNYLLNSHNQTKSMTNETNNSQPDNSDDTLVDISDEKMLEVERNTDNETVNKVVSPVNSLQRGEKANIELHKNTKPEIKLNDIFIKLESIKPSGIPPLTILNEKNGITATLHLAKGEPKEGVSVYVITTVNKNEVPLSNYLFQAVVPKGCKLKLQTPSSTDLPAYNPFLPPSAITQIMLIANPHSVPITLKFIISYTMDDETITEMDEVSALPKL